MRNSSIIFSVGPMFMAPRILTPASRSRTITRRTIRTSSALFCQAEGGMRYLTVTGVQSCALPIFEDEPLHLAAERAGADEVPASSELLPVEHDRHLPGAPLLRSASWRLGVVAAAVPYDRVAGRSEERRVGKGCRSRWSPDH